MLDSVADLHSLCFVRAVKEKGPYASCGVFIAPRRVLTTFHSVSGAKDLTFIAANGNQTKMKRRADGGVHVMDKTLDLAVVEVALDTQSDFASVNFKGTQDRSLFSRRKGWLGTMYRQQAKGHEVVFDPLEDILGTRDSNNYRAAVRAVPGYSGSPVYGADGFTVVSVATHIDQTQQEHEMAFGKALGNDKPMVSFKGPSLTAFSNFMRKVNGKTNFNPAGPKA